MLPQDRSFLGSVKSNEFDENMVVRIEVSASGSLSLDPTFASQVNLSTQSEVLHEAFSLVS